MPALEIQFFEFAVEEVLIIDLPVDVDIGPESIRSQYEVSVFIPINAAHRSINSLTCWCLSVLVKGVPKQSRFNAFGREGFLDLMSDDEGLAPLGVLEQLFTKLCRVMHHEIPTLQVLEYMALVRADGSYDWLWQLTQRGRSNVLVTERVIKHTTTAKAVGGSQYHRLAQNHSEMVSKRHPSAIADVA